MIIENNHKELNLSSDKKDLETINVGDEDKNDNVSQCLGCETSVMSSSSNISVENDINKEKDRSYHIMFRDGTVVEIIR